jgi:hypothetical protein
MPFGKSERRKSVLRAILNTSDELVRLNFDEAFSNSRCAMSSAVRAVLGRHLPLTFFRSLLAGVGAQPR